MRAFYKLVLLAAAVSSLMLWGAGRGAEAQEQDRPDRVTALALDLESLSGDEAAVDMVNSLLGLMFHLKEGQPFVFAFDDGFSDVVGPVETDAEAFSRLRQTVESRIASPPPTEAFDLAAMLAGAYEYLSGLNVSADSALYVFSGNSAVTDAAAETARVGPVLKLVEEKGWAVSNVTKAGTDAGLRETLAGVAAKTGGESFELSAPDGMARVTARILAREGKGSLENIGAATLSPDAIFETSLDVAPGTSMVNMVIFREDDATLFRLMNPDGVEASAAGSASSSVTEYANVVIMELAEPAAGRWTLEARRGSGQISVNRYTSNRYRMELREPWQAVDVGAPLTLIVSVKDGDDLVSVDAGMRVRITDPAGTSVLYDLNDDGVGADIGYADDGNFSASLPPVNLDGRYEVELQMRWPDASHTITTLASFEARLVPTVTLTPEPERILEVGVRSKIGTVLVSVGGQPFAVSARDLEPSAGAGAGVVEIVPKNVMPDEKAFEFDVFYTAQSESRETVVVKLDAEYAGRQVTSSTEQIVVSSVPAPVPMPTPQPQREPAPVPTTAPPPPAPPVEQPSPVVPALIAVGVVALLAAGLGGFWLSTPTPFGYLYTEDGEVAVNFAAIERTGMSRLLSRNRIAGEELHVQGFDGVVFRFRRGEVHIDPMEITGMTVRLNNQPVTDAAQLHDGSWLGAMGRLYMFRHDARGAGEG